MTRRLHIIDEKGFLQIYKWRINIIDLVILLIITWFIISISYFAYKINIKSKYTSKLIIQEEIEKRKVEKQLKLEKQLEDFLKEHKNARKYFK